MERDAPVLQVTHQRIDEPPRPALRDRPAPRLPPPDDLVGEKPGPRLVDRHRRLERHPPHEGPHMGRSELAQDHVPRAHRHAPRPDAPARMLLQKVPERRPVAHRHRARPAQKRAQLIELGKAAAVAFGIGFRVSGELGHRLLGVEIHGDLLTVGQRHMRDRIGVDVGQPVLRHEAQFVQPDDRIVQHQRVPGRTGVDRISGAEDLLRRRPAPGDLPRVKNDAALPRRSEVAGRHEAVVTRPRDDEIRLHVACHYPATRHLPCPADRRSAIDCRLVLYKRPCQSRCPRCVESKLVTASASTTRPRKVCRLASSRNMLCRRRSACGRLGEHVQCSTISYRGIWRQHRPFFSR